MVNSIFSSECIKLDKWYIKQLKSWVFKKGKHGNSILPLSFITQKRFLVD